MSQEILPPEGSNKLTTDYAALMPTTAARHNILPNTVMVLSGHWWVKLPGQGEKTVHLNGISYQFPCGEWFVCETKYFQTMRQTDYPMFWMDGYELMEKTINYRGDIDQRVVTRITPPAGDVFKRLTFPAT